MRSIFVTALLLLLLPGCASRPEVSAAFPGIASLISRSEVETPPARLFIIHGMTTHAVDYADSLVASLAKELELTETRRADQRKDVPGIMAPDGRRAEINLRAYDLAAGGRTRLRVMALTWSPLTTSIKQARFGVDNAVKRALVNGEIKRGVINDGMGDAVLYVGAYQVAMRAAVVMSVCAFLDGEYKDGRCVGAGSSSSEVAFISSSLGSIMLFDAIEDLAQGESAAPVQATLQRTRLFFMFANQLPLLELATLRPQTGTSPTATGSLRGRLQRFMRLAAPTQPRSPGSPGRPDAEPSLQIVAFTDPNDLLSFRLQASDVAVPGVALTNVSHSVATAWFGLFADPLKAHTGYERDEQVLKLVVCGSRGCK